MEKLCCNHKKKFRDEREEKLLINRLNRIEGQVRGIKNMVDNNAYCTDIIVQVSAAVAALNAFNRELLSEHIRSCVTEDIKNGTIEFANVMDIVKSKEGVPGEIQASFGGLDVAIGRLEINLNL